MNLSGQLSSRGHDDGHGTLHLFQRTLVFDMPEEWKQECDGLSGPRLSHTNHVTARHDCGDGLGLNWCRCSPTVLFNYIKTIRNGALSKVKMRRDKFTHQLAGNPK